MNNCKPGQLTASAGRKTMFSGGNVTVYVSNMDRAVRFYSETLGLKLAYRFGDHWASIEAGTGLTIGLHPASSENQAGRKGSMAIGLQLKGSLADAVSALKGKGVPPSAKTTATFLTSFGSKGIVSLRIIAA